MSCLEKCPQLRGVLIERGSTVCMYVCMYTYVGTCMHTQYSV